MTARMNPQTGCLRKGRSPMLMAVIPSQIGWNVVGPMTVGVITRTSHAFLPQMARLSRVDTTASHSAGHSASVVEVQRDRFRMDYHVYSAGRQQIAAKGGGLVVSYDYRSNTKVDLPEHWRAAIERLESR